MPRRLALTLAAGAVALAACSPSSDRITAPDGPRLATAAGGAVEVTTAADAGAGSLRAAIDAATADAGVRTIRVRRGVGRIAVRTPLVYGGPQALAIDGNGVVLDGRALAEDRPALDAVLVVGGGGDLTVRDVRVEGSTGNGILVDLPLDASGAVEVRFDDVAVTGSARHGIIVNDQTGFFTREIEDQESREAGGSPADLRVVLRDVRAVGNGVALLDRDGLRVNEGGLGSLRVEIAGGAFAENGADGIELDERADGSAVFAVRGTRIAGNGFFDETAADLDDGMDVDEGGPGDLVGRFVQVVAADNAEQGIDLNENNLGDLRVEMRQVTASGNGEEGVEFEEDDDHDDYADEAWGGDLVATLVRVTADRNGENDGDAGIKLREKSDGDLRARLVQPAARDNAVSGIQLREGEAGSLDAEIVGAETLRNDGEGIEIREGDGGALRARVQRAVSVDNADAGVRLRGNGTARIQALVATGNGDGPVVKDGAVAVTTAP